MKFGRRPAVQEDAAQGTFAGLARFALEQGLVMTMQKHPITVIFPTVVGLGMLISASVLSLI